MQPHEQRVVEEKKELDEKLQKLNAFIGGSSVFEGLDDGAKGLLRIQQRIMTDYSDVLGKRIAHFTS
jgi:hypothetical protein